ncbi:acetolactate decarboxylase [Caulifigura coniformis]|uniref:acetolactate decarboxylase n=1 Tax=Caulifigura coniformis TaxID=2527983 RepID=UPI0018D264C6|nr:acetolactate decarboxylase [Caulifigura coniformis]
MLSAIIVASAGCAPAPLTVEGNQAAASKEAVADDSLVQYSLITALAAGDYADGVSLRDMLADGDFGIGTFDQLEGELILLEGKVFQALADGTVKEPDPNRSTPFAAVTYFQEDGRMDDLSVATLQHLDELLDDRLPRRNSPYAVRIDAMFDQLTLRSVPAQSEPFPPLVEVVKTQAVWEKKSVRGTMIGFRCPTWVGTLNVPGYHWHFLSDDRKSGGHVLGCQFQKATLTYDECESLLIRIPESKRFDAFNAAEIKKTDIDVIERQRAEEGKK